MSGLRPFSFCNVSYVNEEGTINCGLRQASNGASYLISLAFENCTEVANSVMTTLSNLPQFLDISLVDPLNTTTSYASEENYRCADATFHHDDHDSGLLEHIIKPLLSKKITDICPSEDFCLTRVFPASIAIGVALISIYAARQFVDYRSKSVPEKDRPDVMRNDMIEARRNSRRTNRRTTTPALTAEETKAESKHHDSRAPTPI